MIDVRAWPTVVFVCTAVLQGGSNGGLLVGNMLTRRPDLFGAVLCQVGLRRLWEAVGGSRGHLLAEPQLP